MRTPEPISGLPEWSPEQEVCAQNCMEKIRNVYRAHGFSPLDTPAIERTSTLIGNGGGDNEKQVYGISPLHTEGDTKEKDLALRFDLTVPMARFVASNTHTLAFPYARYALGKVWRGEKAAHARFREFYQCDVDVVGRGELALSYDAKVVAVVAEALTSLGLGDIRVHVNNRKFLQGYLESKGVTEVNRRPVMVSLDKLDKRSKDDVQGMFITDGIEQSVAGEIITFVTEYKDKEFISSAASGESLYAEGARELLQFADDMERFGQSGVFVFDPSIARGLEYYTGNVFETRFVSHPEIGSIASGGRYENLVSSFTHDAFPGVGMSIGITRLLSQVFASNLLPLTAQTDAQVIVLQIDPATQSVTAEMAKILREEGVRVVEYLGDGKFTKQLEYASKLGVPFAVYMGSTEHEAGECIVRNLITREEERYPFEDIDVLAGMLVGEE